MGSKDSGIWTSMGIQDIEMVHTKGRIVAFSAFLLALGILFIAFMIIIWLSN